MKTWLFLLLLILTISCASRKVLVAGTDFDRSEQVEYLSLFGHVEVGGKTKKTKPRNLFVFYRGDSLRYLSVDKKNPSVNKGLYHIDFVGDSLVQLTTVFFGRYFGTDTVIFGRDYVLSKKVFRQSQHGSEKAVIVSADFRVTVFYTNEARRSSEHFVYPDSTNVYTPMAVFAQLFQKRLAGEADSLKLNLDPFVQYADKEPIKRAYIISYL